MNKELIAKAFALADGLDAVTAPGPVSACLRELALQHERLVTALNGWFEKTDWVQTSFSPSELGQHRADVLRHRIEALEKERTALQKECATLQRAIVSLQKEVGRLKAEPKPGQLPQRKPLTDEEVKAAFYVTDTEVDDGFGNFRDGVRFAETANGIAASPDTARLDWLARNALAALDIFGRVKTERDAQDVRKDIDSAIHQQET